jgi:hypothetical protein
LWLHNYEECTKLLTFYATGWVQTAKPHRLIVSRRLNNVVIVREVEISIISYTCIHTSLIFLYPNEPLFSVRSVCLLSAIQRQDSLLAHYTCLKGGGGRGGGGGGGRGDGGGGGGRGGRGAVGEGGHKKREERTTRAYGQTIGTAFIE